MYCNVDATFHVHGVFSLSSSVILSLYEKSPNNHSKIQKCSQMSEDAKLMIFFISIVLIANILFNGSPDLVDAVIYFLTDGKSGLPSH